VRIDFPHDPKGNYDSRATEFLKRKYAREYVMFKNGVKQEVGTPIEKVGFISPNEMASLQVLGIRSLEQITSLDSVAIASLGVNGKYLKEQAQRYLDHQAQERSQLLKSEANKDLEAKVAQLTAQIEALTKASKTTEVVTEEKETKKSK
jgi:hypothetical protein